MNCAELRSMVGLADPEARPDQAALRSHLGGCARCARQHPEIALMLAAAPARRAAAPRFVRRLAAAGIVISALLVARSAMESAPPPAAAAPPAAPSDKVASVPSFPRGRPVASRTTYTRTSATYHRGHAVSATLTCGQWAATPARIPEESSD